jgi:hypothetical protein
MRRLLAGEEIPVTEKLEMIVDRSVHKRERRADRGARTLPE